MRTLWKKENGYLITELGDGRKYRIKRALLRIFFFSWLIFIIGLMAFIFLNPEVQHYVACSEDAIAGKCENQFYDSTYCEQGHWKMPDLKGWLNENGLCSKEFLYAGESYGEKPPFVLVNVGSITAWWLFMLFLINHFGYNRKTKKKSR